MVNSDFRHFFFIIFAIFDSDAPLLGTSTVFFRPDIAVFPRSATRQLCAQHAATASRAAPHRSFPASRYASPFAVGSARGHASGHITSRPRLHATLAPCAVDSARGPRGHASAPPGRPRLDATLAPSPSALHADTLRAPVRRSASLCTALHAVASRGRHQSSSLRSPGYTL